MNQREKNDLDNYITDHYGEDQFKQEFCDMCGHSLTNNNHGFDQNDGHMDGEKLVHSGSCTYCRICNPEIFKDHR